MKNALTDGWLRVALFQMQTILFENVDISEYMDSVLLMMWQTDDDGRLLLLLLLLLSLLLLNIWNRSKDCKSQKNGLFKLEKKKFDESW